jgi:hypothetical protein
MLVALVALSVALGAPAAAMTGGNFILGKSNSADHQTSLTSSGAGKPALALTNTGTAAGSTALKLTTAAGVPPFLTASTTKVTHLNADSLDGLDSTALQRSVTGLCQLGTAAQTVFPDGSLSCNHFPDIAAVDTYIAGPLPVGFVGSFSIPEGSENALVSFTGTGFRAGVDGPGPVGATLWLCRDGAIPCGQADAESQVSALVYANATTAHMTYAVTAEVGVGGGATYTVGLSARPGTSTDANDVFSHSIVTFEP